MATVRRIVVTGGPGSGKTTLLDRLGAAGHERSEEAGRGIIRDQLAVGGAALPWADPALFAELMLCWELRNYRTAINGTVFFDRGLPDIVGYLRVEGLPVPAHMRTAARDFRYARRVFIAPPWPEIYRTDAERAQTPELARRTFEAMSETYADYGYELVELPKAPVHDRVRFLLNAIEER
ncbi:AAA family ATPase [Saccharopolyspora gloriosae]|uniref:AAA family ATPase n=1 Tax=Saccharopolyspora gloriosae TaxID=455344 RepID=UPI001FB7D6D8|nr:AAA family ATPase [Saccharopolyspora gloriosae]